MKKFTLACWCFFMFTQLFATIVPISVTNNQFNPATVNVTVGDTVRYNFTGTFPHNATTVTTGPRAGVVPAGAADINSGPVSNVVPRSYEYKVTVAGNYRYYCMQHSPDGVTGMVGFLVASAPANVNAVIQVAVTSNQFSPANFTATVGDTVRFNFQQGFHNAISTSGGMVPAGAPDINSGAPSGTNPRTYNYKITTAGNYRYYCEVHSSDGLTGMVGFFTVNAIVPANLKGFNARYEKGVVDLSWQTLTEQNVDYFTVKRSFNGIEFTDLTKVKAAGNSTSLQTYQFTDDLIGKSNTYIYYSLATVDKDGKQRLSPIVMVKNTTAVKKLITSLSPNPVTKAAHLMIQFNAEKTGSMRVTVYNAAGKKVIQDDFSAFPGLNNGHLHMGDMPQGIYNIVFTLGNMTETHRVVVK